MLKVHQKIINITAAILIISLLSLSSISYYWKYKTYANLTAVKAEFTNCIKFISYENTFEKVNKKNCKIFNKRITLYYN